MAKKRPIRPAGNGARRFLRDSGTIYREIRKAKGALPKCASDLERGKAIARIQAAETQLRALSKGRFEKIAQDHTTTALRAMDNLIRLTAQNRYSAILTREHADAITQLLRIRYEAVASALNAAVDSQAAKQTVGTFIELSIFSHVGGMAAAE